MQKAKYLKNIIKTSLFSCAIIGASLSYGTNSIQQNNDSKLPKITDYTQTNGGIAGINGEDIAKKYAEFGVIFLSDNTIGFNLLDPKSTFIKFFGSSNDGDMSGSAAAMLNALNKIQMTLAQMVVQLNDIDGSLSALISKDGSRDTFDKLESLQNDLYPKEIYTINTSLADHADANGKFKLTQIASKNNGDDPTVTFRTPNAITTLQSNITEDNKDLINYLEDNPDKASYIFGQEKGILSPDVVKAYNNATNTLKNTSDTGPLVRFLINYQYNTYIQLQNVIENNGNAGQLAKTAQYYLMNLERDFANNIQVDYNIKRMILRTYYYACQSDSKLYTMTVHSPDQGKDLLLRDYLYEYYIATGQVLHTGTPATDLNIKDFKNVTGDEADAKLTEEMTGTGSVLDIMTKQFSNYISQLSLNNLLTTNATKDSGSTYVAYLNPSKTFKDKCSVMALTDNQLYAQCYYDTDKKKPYPFYLGIDMAAATPYEADPKKYTYSRDVELKEVTFESGATAHSYLYIPNIADNDSRVTNGDFASNVVARGKFRKHSLYKNADYTHSYGMYEKDSSQLINPAFTSDEITNSNAMGLHFENSGSNVFDNASALGWATAGFGRSGSNAAKGSFPHGGGSSALDTDYTTMFNILGLRTIKGTPIYYTTYFSIRTQGNDQYPLPTKKMTLGCFAGDDNCSTQNAKDQFTGSVSDGNGSVDGEPMPFLDLELGKVYDENDDFSVLGRTYELQYQLDNTTDRGDGTYNWNLLTLISNHLNLSGDAEVNRISGNFRDNCHVDGDGNIDGCYYFNSEDKQYHNYSVPSEYKDLTTYFLRYNPGLAQGVKIFYPWLDFENGQLNNHSDYFGSLNDFDSYFWATS